MDIVDILVDRGALNPFEANSGFWSTLLKNK